MRGKLKRPSVEKGIRETSPCRGQCLQDRLDLAFCRLQALALGTPVVATDCPNGPAEILEYGKWGPLVPVGDSAALADAIHYQLDAECQAEDSPKHQVAERYGVSNILSQYLGAMNASG